jgi:rod shape-determining protein MreD
MKPLILSREDHFPTTLVPFLTLLFLVLLTTMPVRIPGYAAVTPPFALMAVYHWTLYRPALLPALALFLGGLVFDLLAGIPLGLTPLLFLLVRSILMGQRRFFVARLFPFVWAGFALVAAGSLALQWALASLLHASLLDPRSALLQWVLTVAMFPPASWFLVRVQRAFLAAS